MFKIAVTQAAQQAALEMAGTIYIVLNLVQKQTKDMTYALDWSQDNVLKSAANPLVNAVYVSMGLPLDASVGGVSFGDEWQGSHKLSPFPESGAERLIETTGEPWTSFDEMRQIFACAFAVEPRRLQFRVRSSAVHAGYGSADIHHPKFGSGEDGANAIAKLFAKAIKTRPTEKWWYLSGSTVRVLFGRSKSILAGRSEKSDCGISNRVWFQGGLPVSFFGGLEHVCFCHVESFHHEYMDDYNDFKTLESLPIGRRISLVDVGYVVPTSSDKTHRWRAADAAVVPNLHEAGSLPATKDYTAWFAGCNKHAVAGWSSKYGQSTSAAERFFLKRLYDTMSDDRERTTKVYWPLAFVRKVQGVSLDDITDFANVAFQNGSADLEFATSVLVTMAAAHQRVLNDVFETDVALDFETLTTWNTSSWSESALAPASEGTLSYDGAAGPVRNLLKSCALGFKFSIDVSVDTGSEQSEVGIDDSMATSVHATGGVFKVSTRSHDNERVSIATGCTATRFAGSTAYETKRYTKKWKKFYPMPDDSNSTYSKQGKLTETKLERETLRTELGLNLGAQLAAIGTQKRWGALGWVYEATTESKKAMQAVGDARDLPLLDIRTANALVGYAAEGVIFCAHTQSVCYSDLTGRNAGKMREMRVFGRI